MTFELTNALTLYLAGFLVLLAFTWLFYLLRERRKKKIPPLFDLAICEYCDWPYLAKTHHKVSRCPRCHLLNKSHWYQKKG